MYHEMAVAEGGQLSPPVCMPWPKSYIVGSLAGEMAHLVKCLPHKNKKLSLSPSTQTEKPVCGAHANNPSAGEVETSDPLRFTGQPV